MKRQRKEEGKERARERGEDWLIIMIIETKKKKKKKIIKYCKQFACSSWPV